MKFNLNESITILQRTPTTLQELLLGLPDAWLTTNEGPNTWSPYDIVGHLIHADRTDWMTRAEMILSESANKHFPPFDRFAQFENSKGKSLEQLLDEFYQLRQEKIVQLLAKNLTEADLNKVGFHPEFGKVTLRELLATWVAHDLGHLAQIARVMAKQYKESVGPWKNYLPILER